MISIVSNDFAYKYSKLGWNLLFVQSNFLSPNTK